MEPMHLNLSYGDKMVAWDLNIFLLEREWDCV
jgi:hypothetical protein